MIIVVGFFILLISIILSIYILYIKNKYVPPGPSPPGPIPPSPPGQYQNSCRPKDLSSKLVGPYETCGGEGWTGPTECCCKDFICDGNESYKQCKPKTPSFPKTGPYMTHYWDCCKPSCAWRAPNNLLVKSCDKTGNDVVSPDKGNVCVNSPESSSGMCKGISKNNKKGQYPWIDTDENGKKVLYGYGAIGGDPKKDNNCGKCYEVTFYNARNIDKAIIMVTNGGDSTGQNVDLAVPGGGFGEFNGCKNYSNWKNLYLPDGPCASNPNTPPSKTPNCSQYGGPHDESYCDSMFSDDPEANKSCKDILWGVFGQVGCTNDSGYPANLFIKEKKEITCPSKLTSVLVEN